MPSENASRTGSVFRMLRGQPRVFLGMLAVAFFFMGQFALFTYVRPFLETVTRVNASTLSLLLLIMGVAGLLGTYLIGVILKTRLLQCSNRDAARNGLDRRRIDHFGRLPGGRGKPAGWLGTDRDGRARRVVDMVEQDAASRRRKRGRPHGRGDPTGNHPRCHHWRLVL